MREEVKIKGWVARDEDGGLHLFAEEPKRYRRRGVFEVNPGVWSLNEWHGTHILCLDRESFSDLKWEDEPRKVELTIRESE